MYTLDPMVRATSFPNLVTVQCLSHGVTGQLPFLPTVDSFGFMDVCLLLSWFFNVKTMVYIPTANLVHPKPPPMLNSLHGGRGYRAGDLTDEGRIVVFLPFIYWLWDFESVTELWSYLIFMDVSKICALELGDGSVGKLLASQVWGFEFTEPM